MQHLSEKMQFQGFPFPQAMHKHLLGEMSIINRLFIAYYLSNIQGCSLETLVLVLRRLEDMKNGLGLEIKVLVLILVLKKVLALVLTKQLLIFSKP